MLPNFETRHLAQAVEALSPEQLDQLAFGATRLDADNVVKIRNKTEAEASGLNNPVSGKLFFVDVAPCMNNEYFKGRIDKARQAGTLDISFSFVGDFSDNFRELAVRVQSATDGGCWIFVQRAA